MEQVETKAPSGAAPVVSARSTPLPSGQSRGATGTVPSWHRAAGTGAPGHAPLSARSPTAGTVGTEGTRRRTGTAQAAGAPVARGTATSAHAGEPKALEAAQASPYELKRATEHYMDANVTKAQRIISDWLLSS